MSNKIFPLASAQDKRILVVGDLMLDRYWFGEVNRISPEAPVPVVRVTKREDRLGGAANVARNIVALGAQASLLGIVGQDDIGEQIQILSDEYKINPHLIIDNTINSTLKMRVQSHQQQMIRLDFEHQPSADSLHKLHQKYEQIILEHDVIVLSDYNKGVLSEVSTLITLAKKNNIPVLVDPKGDDYLKYKGASLITPNQTEMIQAVGAWRNENELLIKAEKLRSQLQIDVLLLTRSEKGMSLFSKDQVTHVDAEAHEVFDVSGAGDTVLATLAVTKAAGLSWDEAMRWANKAGGIVVGKLGTSTVTIDELIAS